MSINARDLELEIKQLIDNTGIFNRIFTRVKNNESITRKLEVKDYSIDGKKMQDLIGVRVVVYFNDDISFIKNLLKSKYELVEVVHDQNDTEQFGPTRLNMVFKLPELAKKNVDLLLANPLIDSTFEVQIRSVFSEGWHEVEHDLRYKCKDEWEDFMDESRTLNGILATLENCDWSVRMLFDELAYKNYKKRNVKAMMKNKFRLRFGEAEISSNILSIINGNPELQKKIFRVNRSEVLNKLIMYKLPINYNNIIYIINHEAQLSEKITQMTPKYMFEL